VNCYYRGELQDLSQNYPGAGSVLITQNERCQAQYFWELAQVQGASRPEYHLSLSEDTSSQLGGTIGHVKEQIAQHDTTHVLNHFQNKNKHVFGELPNKRRTWFGHDGQRRSTPRGGAECHVSFLLLSYSTLAPQIPFQHDLI